MMVVYCVKRMMQSTVYRMIAPLIKRSLGAVALISDIVMRCECKVIGRASFINNMRNFNVACAQ